MMTRTTINFVLDLVSFLDLLGLAVTGLVIRYVLPPGTGGAGRSLHGGAGRGLPVQEFWSMTRHEWGNVHFYLAAIFVMLMMIHIALHWKWIQCYVNHRSSK
jgi:hypothetical protein